jgi:hypothetical protein
MIVDVRTQLPRVPSELVERIIHADALAALGIARPSPSPPANTQQQEHSHVR